VNGFNPDWQLARIHANLVAMRDLPPYRMSDAMLAPHQCQEVIMLIEHLAYRAKNAERELAERTPEIDLAQRTAERDEARREICERVSTTRWKPQFPLMSKKQYAEERGWDCFKDIK